MEAVLHFYCCSHAQHRQCNIAVDVIALASLTLQKNGDKMMQQWIMRCKIPVLHSVLKQVEIAFAGMVLPAVPLEHLLLCTVIMIFEIIWNCFISIDRLTKDHEANNHSSSTIQYQPRISAHFARSCLGQCMLKILQEDVPYSWWHMLSCLSLVLSRGLEVFVYLSLEADYTVHVRSWVVNLDSHAHLPWIKLVHQ